MRKLQISKQHRALIESVIRENPRFKGHEKLIDLFCEAIYKKSYLLIDAIRDMSRLRRHLSMICDSSIEQIIREKKRFDDAKLYDEIMHKSQYKQDLVSLREKQTVKNKKETNRKQETNRPEIINLKEEINVSEKYDSISDLIDPIEFYPRKKISSKTVEKLTKIISKIDHQYPQKKYYEIFSLRYIKRFNQTDIAKRLKISQIELSKRFVELITITKNSL